MINTEKLRSVLESYKKDFKRQWHEEKYKWEAVKHFQDHWDINASDFLNMFMEATSKTGNLLASMNNFPRAMMKGFILADPEAVRGMFINLYDENKDLAQRIEKFSTDSENIKVKHGNGGWKQHYQSLNAISIYLWLRYPDKYYIYKYFECRNAARELESNFIPKKGMSTINLINGYKLYDEMCAYIEKDVELIEMFKTALTEDCYLDPAYKTLTGDIAFYISRYYSKKNVVNESEWFPTDYSPNISTQQWLKLLGDKTVFDEKSLKIMKRMKDFGGIATCTQLSNKYGGSINFYNAGSSALAKRIAKVTGCVLFDKNNENSKWWPILYQGKYADKNTEGNYIWKLRDELSEALDQVDLSQIPLYEKDSADNCGYWWLNANPKIWSFSEIGIGEIQSYTLYNDNGNKRRIFQNFLDAKTGDLVIGYESNPVKQIVALLKVAEENDGEKLSFEKIEDLVAPIDYAELRNYPELEDMEFFKNQEGSFFKLTKNEFDFIMDLIREQNPVSKNTVAEIYTKEDFLKEVYMSPEQFDTLIALLKNKKNLILQGAPGVGKTFTAKRLAYAMMGEKDDNRIEFVQFHQNYSYEDFIMGYKPKDEGFELQYGIFYRFCKKAANEPNKPYFFIIDEINRGNISKIFGELLMLIEKDYRGTKLTLAYNGMPFSIPENLHIIGMMNTADRSIAMIDYALRRRFSFYKMNPGFNSDGFKEYQASLDNDTFNELIERIKELNKDIALDPSLGDGFCIGHSYFCGQEECTDEWLKEVIEYDILPTLSEYWFDEPEKVQKWENLLRGVFND